jgi:hypothetical protein
VGLRPPFLFLKYIYVFESPLLPFCPATKRKQKMPIFCVFIRLFAGNGNLLTQKLKSQIACQANDGYKNMTCFSPWCSLLQFYYEKQVFLFCLP